MKTKALKIVFAIVLISFTILSFDFPGKEVTGSFSIELENQEFDINHCAITNSSFEVGEEIVYKLFYNWNFVWIPAGEVIFKVLDEGDKYHLSASGRTYSTYEWFFKVRDQYDAYIDKQTLLPTVSVRDVREGGYRLYDKVTFDHENNLATSLRGKTKEKAVLRQFEVDDCMHDILSIIYFTRNIEFNNLAKNDKVPVKIFMDKEVWPLSVKYQGKEANKKIKGKGRFNTIKFSPEVIVGEVFTENTEMNIWASDDENRIPLLIESPVSVGSVKAVLKSYKNLRNDVTSKVK